MRRFLGLFVLVLCVLSESAFADISHRVSFDGRANHYMKVESEFPVLDGVTEMELVMAGWTPGSYLIRDYARHVENIVSVDANIEKIAKNRWRLTGLKGGTVSIKYDLYAREMTVRTNWVDSEFASLNGAPTFMRPVGQEAEQHRVELVLPKDWKNSATSLNPARFRKNIYIADDWDELVDSPIVAGNLDILTIPTETKHPHYLVQVGDTSSWDNEKAVDSVAKIVEIQQEFWGTDPFDKPYYFLNVIADARGGLEHKHSTALMHRRFAMQSRKDWVNWMNLVGHEYFHSWNVKRMRPKALGPFNYESENYTSELWLAEGITTYYSNLLNHRAGLITQDEFLADIASDLQYLGGTAGQEVRSVADASYDAWIRGYRPDENSTNANVSYYGKGAMVGLGLDAKIREATNAGKSLDDLMLLANEKYAGEIGFTNADIYELVEDLAGRDVSNWLQDRVETAEYLELSNAYEYFGLSLMDKRSPEKESGMVPADLGLHLTEDGTNLILSRVSKGTSAFAAGLNKNDEIIAIDGVRVKKGDLASYMSTRNPGETAELLIARRGRIQPVAVTFGEKPLDKWKLSIQTDATEDQSKNYKTWTTKKVSK